MTAFGNVVQLIMSQFLKSRDIYEGREQRSRTYSWKVFVLSNVIAEIPSQTLMAAVLFGDLVLPTRHVPQCAGHRPTARKRRPRFSSDLVLHVILLEPLADGCNNDARRCYRSQSCLSPLFPFPYVLRVSLIPSELVSVSKHADCFQCICQPIDLAWVLDVHVQSNTSYLFRERAHLNRHWWSEHCMLERRAVDV